MQRNTLGVPQRHPYTHKQKNTYTHKHNIKSTFHFDTRRYLKLITDIKVKTQVCQVAEYWRLKTPDTFMERPGS